MKKIINSILLFVLSFCFAGVLSAHAITISNSGSINGDGVGCKLDGCSAYVQSFQTDDGSPAYCLDPNLDAPENVVVEEEISLSNNPKNAYYAGLATIAENGEENGYNYYTIITALRMYVIASGNSRNVTRDVEGKYYRSTLAVTAVSMMSDNATITNNAFGYNCSTSKCFAEKTGVFGTNFTAGSYEDMHYDNGNLKFEFIDGGNNISNAKKLLKSGIEAAASYKTSGQVSDEPSLSMSYVGKARDVSSNTATHFTMSKYYELKTTNFKSTDLVKDLSVTCTNCSSVPGSPTVAITGYTLNGTKYNGVPSNDVLKSLTGNSKITIEVTVKVSRDSGYNCSDINYDINYSSNYVSSNYVIKILKSTGTDSVNNQRFLSIALAGNSDGTQVFKDYKYSGNHNFCDPIDSSCIYETPSKDAEDMTEEEYTEAIECCEDWLNSCEADSTKNADHCKYYNEYCGACDTEIVVPTACTYVDGEESEVEIGYVNSAIDGDNKENIKFCLLALKKDEEGNSYQTEESKENNYCKVYCKEDYEFNLPKALSVNSGSYFHLDATISGTKSCYTSEIDTVKFKADIDALNSKYSSYSSDYASEYEKIVADYNACINMDTNYDCFDPEIEYSYEESYNDMLGEDNKFVKVGEVANSNVKTTKCNDEINDDYSCNSEATTEAVTITKRINGGTTQVTFNATKYVKSTITKTGNYRTPSVFYTQRGTDIITKDEAIENGVKIDGLPVEVKTEKGEHKFTLTLKNIGEYYDKSSCKSGRLIGDENSIYNSKNEGKTNAEYQCHYYVNCPECDFGCEGELCEMEFCDGKECEATCLGNGCAYDNEAGLSYVYRTVSLNSMNPTSRDLGYNWDTEKGEATMTSIENTGENAYETPEYSFTLTPALISEIKEYNKSQLNNGGYADNSLTCQDDKYGNEKVNCESDFIKKLQNGEIGNSSNQLTVPDYEDKFTSWLDSDYCNGACTITKRSGIGPSWK